MKLKKIFRTILLFIFLLLLFPSYILISRIKNDYPLREYVKDKFLSQLKQDFSTYFSFKSTDEIYLNSLYITIPDSSMKDLRDQVNQRIQDLNISNIDLLGNGAWKYIKASAFSAPDSFNIKLRIRGDMSSNYNRAIEMSTLRFNVLGGKAFNGKTKLSIIRPELESGYYGYLFYKCFKDQNFLSNEIELIKLYINEEYAGLRFLQEGFSKELIESSGRREGPILRFKNDCVDSEGRYNAHLFPELVTYKEKKALKEPDLSKVYSRALNKYNEFVKGNIDISKCFNIDEYARFYALCDIFLSHHSNKCQNVKLYFNPINDKFEPIAWDPNTYDRYELKLPIFPGHTQRFGELCHQQKAFPLQYLLSKDAVFLNKYANYLNGYIENDSSLKLINKYMSFIKKTEPILFRQNFQEHFSLNKFKNNIKNIRQDFNQNDHLYGNYFSKTNTLTIRSLSNIPIIIDSIKYGDVTKKVNFIVSPNDNMEKTFQIQPIKEKYNLQIFSRILGTQNVSKYKAKVFYQKDDFSSIFFNERFDTSYFLIDSTAKTFRLKNTDIILSQNLYIPDFGMTWLIESNTKIELNNANIVCESPVMANGAFENPIRFISDQNGGILVKNAPRQSFFNYVEFTGLSAPYEDNWSITGAVTFYKSDVVIKSCLFKNSQSEDALNIVSSKFKLQNVKIENSFSDALDIDFGNGIIEGIIIHSAKNNGLDFSGSEIKINQAELENIGDKAISLGEKSLVKANNIIINESFIAITSKDESIIQLEKIKINNCTYNFTAYQKNPQYGFAKIEIMNSKLDKTKWLIEKGSSISLNGILTTGNEFDIHKRLYLD